MVEKRKVSDLQSQRGPVVVIHRSLYLLFKRNMSAEYVREGCTLAHCKAALIVQEDTSGIPFLRSLKVVFYIFLTQIALFI